MEVGDVLIIGISILVVLLVAFAAIFPRIRKWRLVLKKVEPKKRRAKPTRKKRKAIVIKLI